MLANQSTAGSGAPASTTTSPPAAATAVPSSTTSTSPTTPSPTPTGMQIVFNQPITVSPNGGTFAGAVTVIPGATPGPTPAQISATNFSSGWRAAPGGMLQNIYNGQEIVPVPGAVLPTVYSTSRPVQDPMAGVMLPQGTPAQQAQLNNAINATSATFSFGQGANAFASRITISPDVDKLTGMTSAQLTTLMPTLSKADQTIAQSIMRYNSYVGQAQDKYSQMNPSQLEGLLNPAKGVTSLNQVTATIPGALLAADHQNQYKNPSYTTIQSALGDTRLTPMQAAVFTQLSVQKAPATFTFANIQVLPDSPQTDCAGSGASGSCSSGRSSGGVNMGALFGGFSNYNGVGSGANAPPVPPGLKLAAQITTGVVLSAALAIGTGGAVGVGLVADGATDGLSASTAILSSAANAAARAAAQPAIAAAKVALLLGIPALTSTVGGLGGGSGAALMEELGGNL